MEDKKYIECGKIINTHGCRGGLKTESWCDSPEILANFKRVFIKSGAEYHEHPVNKSAIFKQYVLFELGGIDDMDAAIALKGTVIYAAREDFCLGEDEYFIADIIGCDVVDADSGRVYGTLSEIINRGASDIYVVATDNGEVMIPAVDEFVVKVQVGRAVHIRPIGGMFD